MIYVIVRVRGISLVFRRRDVPIRARDPIETRTVDRRVCEKADDESTTHDGVRVSMNVGNVFTIGRSSDFGKTIPSRV